MSHSGQTNSATVGQSDSRLANRRIYVAGHRGLVGSSIVRALRARGHDDLVLRTHADLELEDQRAVFEFFERERPDFVFLAAAKVGGIHANSTYPADFIRSNLAIQLNIIEAAYRSNVTKLLFLGSSCIYPRLAPQPMREDALLTGALEPTNEWYAIAKIAGIKLCQAYNRQHGTNFISVMPTNLYGPNDNFDLKNSHVLPAMIRRFHDAKVQQASSVTLWGSGTPSREFLHVDDLAAASLFLMERYDGSDIVNIGCGEEITIRALAELVRDVVGYAGAVEFDRSKPDGSPRKLMDVSRLKGMGWSATIPLEVGIRDTYAWYLAHDHDSVRLSTVAG